MARINIFQRLAELNDLGEDAARMDSLFTDSPMFYNDYGIYKLTEVNNFLDWKNRGHCLNVEDYLETINYETLVRLAMNNDVDSFLSLTELILNFFKLAEREIDKGGVLGNKRNEWFLLQGIIEDDLERLNHKAIYNVEMEQVLVVEDDPVATAVAEIVEPDLSKDVIRYHHHLLKGDLKAKKEILFQMGKELEPKRNFIKNFNKNLSEDIFFMLNKMDIRHNDLYDNIKDENQSWLAKMNVEELENWYDELYQMMLLAFLELDQIERNKRIKELMDRKSKSNRQEEVID